MDWPLKWDDLLDSRLDLRTVGPEGGDDYDGTDVYPTTTTMAAAEEDEEEEMAWLSSDLLSYQPLLNDCMLSQMSNVPVLSNSKDMMFSSCSQSLNDQEFEQDLLTLVNPNMAMMLDEEGEMLSGVEKLPTGETMSTETCALGYAETDECLVEKKVQVSLVPAVVSISGIGTPTYVVSCMPSKNSLLKPQMITLPSHTLAPLEVSERLNQKLPNLSKVQIRVMTRAPAVGAIGVAVSSKESSKALPLSPPNSDSDGSVSPVRSERLIVTQKSLPRNLSLTRPKIMNHVSLLSNLMPSSGSLFLSEEEEHTLISEGYPVPTRWPLTKQEEKILKKIQRKIKNKVSAQESRRKKKDYIDSLEKRLEASNLENSSLKKKVEKLEHGNRAIKSQIEQLKKAIQSMSTQTSTCIMAFVLFFALLLGALNPLTMTHLSPRHPSLGLSEVQQLRNPITSDLLSAGPQVTKEISDYKTPNMKSRILLSVLEDPEVESAETPGSVCSGVLSWLSVLQLSHKEQHCEPQPEIIVASAIPLIVEIHGQNPVRSSLENQTEAKIGVQKPDLVDSIYLTDFVTIPASES